MAPKAEEELINGSEIPPPKTVAEVSLLLYKQTYFSPTRVITVFKLLQCSLVQAFLFCNSQFLCALVYEMAFGLLIQ